MAERAKEKDLNIKQVPFRIHNNDYILLKKLLSDEDLRFQHLVDACVQAYMRGDPHVMKVVKDYVEQSHIPKEHKDQYTLSQRERSKLLDELEDNEPAFETFEQPRRSRGE